MVMGVGAIVVLRISGCVRVPAIACMRVSRSRDIRRATVCCTRDDHTCHTGLDNQYLKQQHDDQSDTHFTNTISAVYWFQAAPDRVPRPRAGWGSGPQTRSQHVVVAFKPARPAGKA